MCEDIPCIKNCPTGALDPKLGKPDPENPKKPANIADARMGLAVLADQENCIAFLGLRCEICYNACPVIGKAITLEKRHNPRSDRHAMLLPTVHSEHCTGCGLCEKACILEESAIRVLPPALAQGKGGKHYLKGWEEKEKHGGSLIGDQLELPVRGLEGKSFGDTRVYDEAPPSEGSLKPPPSFDPAPPPDSNQEGSQ
jgi:ferredoxin-type protein NapG